MTSVKEKISYPIDATLSDVVNKKCPILCAMEVIGSKYKLPLIWYLHEKKTRASTNSSVEYRALRRGISLTDFGKELILALNELYAWGEKILNKPV